MTEPPTVLSVLRESPKYLSRHGDSSVRLYLPVSRLAWELSMVEVEDQVFPVFLFFLFSVHLVFFPYMYVNFIEQHLVSHCVFSLTDERVIVTNWERTQRAARQARWRVLERLAWIWRSGVRKYRIQTCWCIIMQLHSEGIRLRDLWVIFAFWNGIKTKMGPQMSGVKSFSLWHNVVS